MKNVIIAILLLIIPIIFILEILRTIRIANKNKKELEVMREKVIEMEILLKKTNSQ